MTSIAADVRQALRAARRRPGFTALAVMTIGLGIGATSAIFSVLKTVVLEPLPYAAADRVVTLHLSWTGLERGDWLSGPEILDLRSTRALTAVGGYDQGLNLNLTGDGEPERLVGTAVTSNIFGLLGVAPLYGRAFTAEEDTPGGPEALLLSHGLWQRRFGGDPTIVGRAVRINGVSRTVVGVMPPSFAFPYEMLGNRSDVWIPFRFDPAQPGSRGSHYIYAVGRLADGVAVASANAELATLAQRLTAEGEYPPEATFKLFALPARDFVTGGVRPILLLLLGAVGLVLLIACVNVANLLLERAEGRRREFAVRAALGADRGRIVRQLLVEHGVIAGLGAVLGLALAVTGIRTMVALAPSSVPRIDQVGLDPAMVLFTFLLTAVCALVFGLAPLLHAGRVDLHSALATGASRSTMGRAQQQLRRTLVAAELALAVMLLAGAGLTLRTFAALLAVDPGFEPAGVLTMQVATPAASYPQPEQVTAFYQSALERLRALPGVTAAGAVRRLPLAEEIGDWSIALEGREPPQGQDFDGDWQIVAPGYFETMRVRLISGRTLADADHAGAPAVAVINETMARQYWPAGDALGKRFRIGDEDRPWVAIVGVVADERHAALAAPPNRRWFRPHAQWTQSSSNPIRGMTIVVRAAGDPLALAGPVRDVVRGLDAALPVANIRTLETVVAESVAAQRFTMLLLAVFAATALLLAAVGVYGVMAYWVTERTGEIGVRMALGATRGEVTRMVLAQALRPALTGIAVGGVAALALTGLMRGLLYGVQPRDPVTFALTPVVLLVVAVVASLVPAHRAARQDPVTALRYE